MDDQVAEGAQGVRADLMQPSGHRSILTEKISRRGFHVSREYAIDPLEILFVREVMRTNRGGTESVLAAMRRAPEIERLVVTSSSEIYGGTRGDSMRTANRSCAGWQTVQTRTTCPSTWKSLRISPRQRSSSCSVWATRCPVASWRFRAQRAMATATATPTTNASATKPRQRLHAI